MVTTGGTNLKDDIVRLYDPVHIIVATPGRIVDLMNKNLVKTHDCKILVLDEVCVVVGGGGGVFWSCLGLLVLIGENVWFGGGGGGVAV